MYPLIQPSNIQTLEENTMSLKSVAARYKSKKKKTGKMSESLLKWRSKQKPGAIMKASTFKHIAATSKGGKRAAGSAYWGAARKKFAESRE
jgi:hypothetical protein